MTVHKKRPACLDHAAIKGAYRHSLALAAQPKLSNTFTARSPPTPTAPPSTTQPLPLFNEPISRLQMHGFSHNFNKINFKQ